MDELYPVTIFRTRYGGVYEGGEWAAFPLAPESVPVEAKANDVTCASWWSEFGSGVGVGASPDSALADLEQKVRSGQFYRDPDPLKGTPSGFTVRTSDRDSHDLKQPPGQQ